MAEPDKNQTQEIMQATLPPLEIIQRELGSAKSMDDFFGKNGIFARVFGRTLETLLEAELTETLGYEKYAASGRNSGNSRNGKVTRKLKSSGGETEIRVPGTATGNLSPPYSKNMDTTPTSWKRKSWRYMPKGSAPVTSRKIFRKCMG